MPISRSSLRRAIVACILGAIATASVTVPAHAATSKPSSLRVIVGSPDENANGGETTPGKANRTNINSTQQMAVDSHGNVYNADWNMRVVEKITPKGRVIFLTQPGYGRPRPGKAIKSKIGSPRGVAVDKAGNVYIADAENSVIEKITPSGRLSIVAGEVRKAGNPTPGKARDSRLRSPGNLGIDGQGNLYIADSFFDEDARTLSCFIEKIDTHGEISIVAGSPHSGSQPTPGATADSLGYIQAMTVDPSGNLYVAAMDLTGDLGDWGSLKRYAVLEKVAPNGELTIVAGSLKVSGKPTVGKASESKLHEPGSLAADKAGNIYIADRGNGVVEKVNLEGHLSIVAGRLRNVDSRAPSHDPPWASERLDNIDTVAVGGLRKLYITSSGQQAIDRLFRMSV